MFLSSLDSPGLRAHSTPLLQDWLGDDEVKRHRRTIHFPTGRFGEAIEEAQAVVFLASDESSFVIGQDFVVDGGMSRVSTVQVRASEARLTVTLQCYITPEGPVAEGPKNLAH